MPTTGAWRTPSATDPNAWASPVATTAPSAVTAQAPWPSPVSAAATAGPPAAPGTGTPVAAPPITEVASPPLSGAGPGRPAGAAAVTTIEPAASSLVAMPSPAAPTRALHVRAPGTAAGSTSTSSARRCAPPAPPGVDAPASAAVVHVATAATAEQVAGSVANVVSAGAAM